MLRNLGIIDGIHQAADFFFGEFSTIAFFFGSAPQKWAAFFWNSKQNYSS
jgi:hypothetical protein